MTYIYKLKINGKSYVGSTNNMSERMRGHKSPCYNINSKSYNIKLYEFIRENGGWNNVDICILQKCNEDVRYIIEDFYIKHYKCELNNISAIYDVEKRKKYIQTYNKPYYKNNKEKILQNVKNYYENNKEKVLNYQKEYSEKNKERISERTKQKYNCICGSSLRKSDKKRHERSKKHQKYLSLNQYSSSSFPSSSLST